MEDDSILSFNFWPAFADLMLSLILILLLVIGGAYFSSIDIRSIQEKQKTFAKLLLSKDRGIKETKGGVEIRDSSGRVIYRLAPDPHDPMLHTISFSDSLLFNPDDYKLKSTGEKALDEVGRIIHSRLNDIVEIQVRGHADTRLTTRYKDNLELASQRANEVFRFLKDRVKVDPSEHLMSATSFGEYSPVQRERDAGFNTAQLSQSNVTDSDRAANRRIELVLFYRKPKPATSTAAVP